MEPLKERREFNRHKLQKSLTELGAKIKREAFALNQPFTVAENGYVVSLYKDGRKEIISKIEPVERKMKGMRYTLPD